MRFSTRLGLLLVAVLYGMTTFPQSVVADDQTDQIYPVAVLPFKERGGEVKELGGKVTDLVFAHLVSNPELFLVDREDMENVLDEQELSLSGMVKPGEAVQVGQLTGAKLIVTGTVMQIDNTLYLVAKIIGTETTRVLGASVKGSARDDLGDLAEKLAEQVATSISENSAQLVAKPVSRDDRIAKIKRALGRAERPAILIEISERHVGQVVIDPAAETEMALLAEKLGFAVIDPDEGDERDAQIVITGEGMSAYATRHGNLVSVRARLEIKAVDKETGKVIAVDRQTSVAVGLSEQIAGKTALQTAAATISQRMLPKITNSKEGK